MIKDPSGKPIPKGNLVLWDGIQGKSVPFENGLYSLMGLEDRTYRVTIRAEGFGEVEKNLQAKKGEVKQIDLVLPPANFIFLTQIQGRAEDQAMIKGRAFSLLSGGLDSLLASRLIMEQGIEVIALHFITPFFGYQKKGQEERYQERWKQLYGIQARIIDVSDEYFQVLRHPRHGYGKNFNPCIDCKIFFLAKAKGMMEEEKVDFLVTGEVLGQRPMSQRRDTMRIVERDSGTDGFLLRPLCAQLLKPTRPEVEGLVDREKLLGMTGRSRKPQMELAERMGIRHYPSPAGGCLLTDPELANRIRKFFYPISCGHGGRNPASPGGETFSTDGRSASGRGKKG